MKNYLIGHLPPPYGGVSVYIYRLKKQIEKNSVKTEIIDFSRLNKIHRLFTLFILLFNPTPSSFYLNTSNYNFMFLLLFRPFKSRITYYDHNYRFLENLTSFQKSLFRIFLKRVETFEVVEEKVIEYYKSNKIKIPINTNIKNAFIAPPSEDEAKIKETYNDDFNAFRQDHSPLLIANSFKIDFYENIDLYGLDLCVELTEKLSTSYKNMGFIFALSEENHNKSYIEQIKNRMQEMNIGNNFFFLKGSKEIWPLFKEVDLFVRPTSIDGDALSIREAMYFGCPVVASNVCKRPEGTICFNSRDINDLLEKCINLLDKKIAGSNK